MKKILPLIFSLLPLSATAGDDFGLWTEAAVQKDFGKKFSVDGGLELRMADKLRQPSRWAFSLGADWKPCKYVSLGAGYVFIHAYNPSEREEKFKEADDGTLELDAEGNLQSKGYNVDHAFWRNKHRATFDVSGKLPLGRFTLSLRERYQYTHYVATSTLRSKYRDELPASMDESSWEGDLYPFNGRNFTELKVEEKAKRGKNRHYLRSRLTLEYRIRHCAWTPYVSYELCDDLADGFRLDKKRLTAGAEWKVSKHHRLTFAYLYEDGTDDDGSSDSHILSIGYKFKF